MMLRILFTKINSRLICTVILFLFSINAISINKVKIKNTPFTEQALNALGDSGKRDVFIKISKIAIAPDDETKFMECVDQHSLIGQFYESIPQDKIDEKMNAIGKTCSGKKEAFNLTTTKAVLLQTLGVFIDSSSGKLEAIDKFIGQRESHFHQVNFKLLNSVK